MMNPLNNISLDNRKLAIILIFSIAIIYMDISLILGPQLSGIQSISPKIAKLKKDIETLKGELRNMQETKKKMTAQSELEIKRLKKFIPSEQVAGFLEDIASMAKKNDVQITHIKPIRESRAVTNRTSVKANKGGLPAAPKSTQLSINLDIAADYHHFGQFINDLENAREFLGVQSFKISAQPANSLKQKITLVLRTYVSE